MDIIQPEDQKYYVHTPDPNFSPRRNQAIIQETIKETTQFFNKLGHIVNAEAEDRIDILNSYARYRFNRGDKSFESYAGRELTKKLIGEKILSKVRVLDTVDKLSGRTKILL